MGEFGDRYFGTDDEWVREWEKERESLLTLSRIFELKVLEFFDNFVFGFELFIIGFTHMSHVYQPDTKFSTWIYEEEAFILIERSQTELNKCYQTLAPLPHTTTATSSWCNELGQQQLIGQQGEAATKIQIKLVKEVLKSDFWV